MAKYYDVSDTGMAHQRLTQQRSFHFSLLLGSAIVGLIMTSAATHLPSLISQYKATLSTIGTFLLLIGCIGISLYIIILTLYNSLHKVDKNPLHWPRQADIAASVDRWLRDSALANRLPGSRGFLTPTVKVDRDKDGMLLVKIEITSTLVGKEDEFSESLASALAGRYSKYVPIDYAISDDKTHVTYYCDDVDTDNTFTPTTIDDYEPDKPYQYRLATNVTWNTAKANNALIAGGIGSGKTTEVYGIMAQAFAKGADVFLVDPKAEFAFPFVAKDHHASEVDDVVALVEYLSDLTAKRHQQATAYNVAQGTTGQTAVDAHLQPVIVIADEVGALASRLKKSDAKAAKRYVASLQDIIYTGRSAGVNMILLAQQPNASVIDTSIRDNLQLRILLGSAGDELRRMVFGEAATLVPTTGAKFRGHYQLDGSTGRVPPILRNINLFAHKMNTVEALAEAYHYGVSHSDWPSADTGVTDHVKN